MQSNSANISVSALAGDGAVGGNLPLGRLFSVIPVIGASAKGTTHSYALYNLMSKNPGYDVVFYPQYEVRKKGFPFFYMKTTVVVTARLAKVRK